LKHRFLVAATTACILTVLLGTFSVYQTLKCKTLEGQIKVLQPQNEKLERQVQNMTSSLENLQKQQNSAVTPAALADPISPTVATAPQNPTLADQKTAYLTFDDGSSQNTPHLLDILKENNVKATFFVVAMGKDTPEKRAWMQMEVADGNTIGVHSFTHKYSYIYQNEANFLTDFNEMKNIIVSATGVVPHGKPIMPLLLQDVEKMGITPVDWNAGGMDATDPVPSTETIVNGVVNECARLKTAVILLHDSQPHESSIDAVPEIIAKLRAMGFVFKPLTPGAPVIRRDPVLKQLTFKK
jgi:peptidoglycan/xylan/chitin deacetylase (PgdA/CDA1 family)